MKTYSKKEDHRLQPSTAIGDERSESVPPQQTGTPPFQISADQGSADSNTSAQRSINPSLSAGQTLQRTPNVEYRSLPEQLGPRQRGSLAVRGTGDADAFSINDINQGSIGDCYFLAALGGIAHTNPNLLRQAITENSNGTYSVRLYRKVETGFLFFTSTSFVPVEVSVYPNFPGSVNAVDAANPNASANPAHAHGGDNNFEGNPELWVRIVEKAYALFRGSYKIIGSGGLGASALETLTGQAHTERVLDDGHRARIIEAVRNGIATEAGTTQSKINNASAADRQFAAQNSIVGGHAYTVIAADATGITVRNPWGTAARNATPRLTWAQFDALFNQYSSRN